MKSLAEATAGVCDRLAANKRVRRSLPGNGRLHIDRQLPFLCIGRLSADEAATAGLVTSQASYLVAGEREDAQLQPLIRKMAGVLAEKLKAFLLVEVRARKGPARRGRNPRFWIVTGDLQNKELSATLQVLKASLKKLTLHQQNADVELEESADLFLRTSPDIEDWLFQVRIEIDPVYLNPDTQQVYPLLYQRFRQQFAVALKEAFFQFGEDHTSLGAVHFHALGRRAMTRIVSSADEALTACDRSFDFLLQVTPVNAERAWQEFRRQKFQREPRFLYRPLPVDPELLKRNLYAIALEEIEDPTLEVLFRRKRQELDRQISMLFELETPPFLYSSIQLYGGVGEGLLKLAREILAMGGPDDDAGQEGRIDAAAFASRAEAEFHYYRRQGPSFSAQVEVREDIPRGLLVSGSRLLIGAETRIPEGRVNALLQHEVGTHLVTYFNGGNQPFRLLQLGLSGYEQLQEGLGALGEYLAGGWTRGRARVLAARVLAVRTMIDGATFIDGFRLLHREFGFEPQTAYSITMRVFRGGGFTKDAIYLRGFQDLVHYLKGGRDIEALFVGKFAADHIPFIHELKLRGVLKPSRFRPRYLFDYGTKEKLQNIYEGTTVKELIAKRRP